jgi:mannose-1-phosphate guanylyltransferase
MPGMIAVIIAGGSGTRLWPLSTPDYPKHLLKINGDDLSLLQHSYERAKQLADKIFVVPEISHSDHVKQQLPDLPDEAFIVEPARRGTSSCIVAALEYVARTCDPDEPIAFLSADHYVRDIAGFTHSFKLAADTSTKSGRITLIGIEPDYAATGFGYIEKGDLYDEPTFVSNVNCFTEKPDHKTAQAYLDSGNYLWNSGYFVGSVKTFKNAMQKYAPDLFDNYNKLATASKETYMDTYLSFENISIDYALIEKVKDLLVVPASFDWMDLGSFADLAKAVGDDKVGNTLHGSNIEIEAVNNSYIHNDEDKPIALIGLDNVVVINTPSGILVTRKDMSQKVGEVSKRIIAKNATVDQ